VNSPQISNLHFKWNVKLPDGDEKMNIKKIISYNQFKEIMESAVNFV